MGSCFGIVPYVDAPNTGTIAGIVGAGGNVGAILFLRVWKIHLDYAAFSFMASFCFVSAGLTLVLVIKGYRGILFGKEREGTKRSLVIPNPSLGV
jgi:nitrate/nitrite transporter NarK